MLSPSGIAGILRVVQGRPEISDQAALRVAQSAPLTVVLAAARTDPEIYRALVRRSLLRDPVDALEANTALLARAAAVVAERGPQPTPPPSGPARDAVLARLRQPTPA